MGIRVLWLVNNTLPVIAQPTPTYCTYTQFSVSGLKNKRWALKQMAILPKLLSKLSGVSFIKYMGTGGGTGFSLWPDWGTYGLLIAWHSEEDCQEFFRQHPLAKAIEVRSAKIWTAHLQSIRSRGLWDHQNPFGTTGFVDQNQPVFILTRATIPFWKALLFWKNVPKVGNLFKNGPKGMLYAKGIGERPIFQQATISIWNSAAEMRTFAYREKEHKQVIAKTRKHNWYSEELFAEFSIIRLEGHDAGMPKFLNPIGNLAA